MLQNELRKITFNFGDCERSNDVQSSGKFFAYKNVGGGAGMLYDDNKVIQ